MQTIITAKNLRYLDTLRYPAIEIEQGSATFICGASGSGKTTLLRLFNGTLSPAEGTVRYGGTDINEIDAIRLRREVLLAGQVVYLFDDTIRGNFEQYFAYRGEPCASEEEMLSCLHLCSLEMPLTSRCQTLSGGERQRVFLAIHLAMRPKVLMLDEPTSALDQKTARQLLERIKAHCRQEGITLVAISHDPVLAAAYADHRIALTEEACE